MTLNKWGDRRELNPRGQIHSLPPEPLGHGHNRCRKERVSLDDLPGELVEEEGIEPSFAGCRPAVLPLNDSPERIGNVGANGANRTLVGCLRCNCSRIELHRLGARGGNRNPGLRITSAVLFHLSYSGVSECGNRRHTRQTLERAEIIEISSLGWRPRAHPIYHARSFTCSVCQRPRLRHTSSASLPNGSELEKTLN